MPRSSSTVAGPVTLVMKEMKLSLASTVVSPMIDTVIVLASWPAGMVCPVRLRGW